MDLPNMMMDYRVMRVAASMFVRVGNGEKASVGVEVSVHVRV